MRFVRTILLALLGGALCGWAAARVVPVVAEDVLSGGGSASFPAVLAALWPPAPVDGDAAWILAAVWAGVALAVLLAYDWTGEKRARKEVKGQEYGDSRWATEREMDAFAHTSTSRKVDRWLPQRPSDRRRYAKRHPAQYAAAVLGRPERVADPKPSHVERLEDDNIILSERARLQLSKIPDPELERNKHVYVLGGSGSGKTFNYVGPNLLQLNSSYVVTDPKGDTLKQYGNFFLRHGYKLKVVNIKGDQIGYSMHYNPFMYLQNSTSIMQIVNLLVENTSGNAEVKEDFFVKAEKQLYMALIGYLFYYYRDSPEYQTFPQVLDLLLLASKDDPNQAKSGLDVLMLGHVDENGALAFEGFEQWLVARYGGEAAAQASEEYFVIKQYKGFKSTAGSPETEASVIASCNVRLAPFSVAALREFFSEDELELGSIGEEPTAFFLVMSDTDSTFNFILAMLLYQLFDVNTAIADRNKGSHCRIPVQCILDELANIGRIPDLDVKIATLRSRWIYITAILQSSTQLKKMYKDNADVIEGNCDTTLFLGRCDNETNKKISERLGKHTIKVVSQNVTHGRQGSWSDNESVTGKELMSAADLGTNPEKFGGSDCIVMIKSAHAFLDRKYRTIDHPRYHELREAGEFDLASWAESRSDARGRELSGYAEAYARGAERSRMRRMYI